MNNIFESNSKIIYKTLSSNISSDLMILFSKLATSTPLVILFNYFLIEVIQSYLDKSLFLSFWEPSNIFRTVPIGFYYMVYIFII